MKKQITLALAASTFVLTLAVMPPHASAAVDIFLNLDGVPGESTDLKMPQIAPILLTMLLR